MDIGESERSVGYALLLLEGSDGEDAERVASDSTETDVTE